MSMVNLTHQPLVSLPNRTGARTEGNFSRYAVSSEDLDMATCVARREGVRNGPAIPSTPFVVLRPRAREFK